MAEGSESSVAGKHGPGKTDRLYKCGEHVQIGGVCSGVGEHLGIDRNLVRALTIVLYVLTGPIAVIVYLVGYLTLPLRPGTTPYRHKLIPVMLLVGALVAAGYVLLLALSNFLS